MKYVFKKILNVLPSFGDDGDDPTSEANEVNNNNNNNKQQQLLLFTGGPTFWSAADDTVNIPSVHLHGTGCCYPALS